MLTIRCSPSSLMAARVTGVSFMNALLFPAALTSRRKIHSSATKSRSLSSKNFFIVP